MAVGALRANREIINQGTVAVFYFNGSSWTQQATLTAVDPAFDDFFGIAVSLSASGDTLVVGVGEDDVEGKLNQGSAYVFTRTERKWKRQAHLIASAIPGQPDAAGNALDNFGYSVAISGDGNTILIGALQDREDSLENRGSAYLFKKSAATWILQTQLLAQDGQAKDLFGRSVSLNFDGTTALIGTECADAPAPDQGAAYVFDQANDVWTQQAKLTASNGEAGDVFGFSAAISSDGKSAVIGAFAATVNGIAKRGTVYYFRISQMISP